jgi:hypothetical protein
VTALLAATVVGGYGCAVGSGRAAAPVPAVGAGRRGSLTPAGRGPSVPGRGVDRRRLCSSCRHQPVPPPTISGRGTGSVTLGMLSS